LLLLLAGGWLLLLLLQLLLQLLLHATGEVSLLEGCAAAWAGQSEMLAVLGGQ
jgi:hypothetical protein